MPPAHQQRLPRRRFLPWLLAGVLCLSSWLSAEAPLARPQNGALVESGVPDFVVLGPEALGMNSSLLNLMELPDGRLLVAGRSEFALGDGVRWVSSQRSETTGHRELGGMVAAQDGNLYASVSGGFTKIVFDEQARWTCQGLIAFPPELPQASLAFSRCIQVGGEWLWNWGSGPVLRWKPGQSPRVLGSLNAPERAFLIDGRVHVSDSSTGALYRLEGDSLRAVIADSQTYVDRTILCSAPLPQGGDLLGTRGRGLLWVKDGVARPFSDNPLLSGEQRIQDLRPAAPGYFVAAVDTVGLVFFDDRGRVVQVLDRSLDHRLAHIRNIVTTRHGLIWALLDDGLLRVNFPSRASHLGPLVASGLNYAVPYRFGGRLWLMSDGKAQRGVYDDHGRLLRMELDSPDTYLCSMTELYGHLLACGRSGIHVRDGLGWQLLAPGVVSAHIRPVPVSEGRWIYVARDEVGWLQHDRGRFAVTRIPMPGLGEPYGAVGDAEGVFWVELGTGRLARIEPRLPTPLVETFGPRDGLPDGWVQAFLLDGRVRINAGGRILRLDSVSRKWIDDADMLARFPELQGAEGRPARDSLGRLWITRSSGVVVRDSEAAHLLNREEHLSADLRPLYYFAEPDGVMWMLQQMRLVRYDPSMPSAPSAELRAVIAQVQLPMSNRVLVPRDGHIEDLVPADQSMILHIQAPGVPMGQAVTFEVQMEGFAKDWVSTGSTGTAAFNRLGPGRHILHVRPRCDGMPGSEAILEFTVRAPWYRSTPAYAGYAALLAMLGWLGWWIPRREKQRLAMMVAVRTAELNSRNAELNHALRDSLAKASALKLSEDRYRRLSENAPDVIFRLHLHPEPAFDYLSPAIERITGHAPEAFYARPSLLADITHPPGSPTLLDLARNGRLREGIRELAWMGVNGDLRQVEERLVVVRDGKGAIIAVEGIARDITERKASEGLIRTLSQAVDQSPAGVMIIDLSGLIIFANPRMGGILGYEHNELIGRGLRQLEVDIARPELVERLWTAMAIGNSWKGELAVQHREGRTVHLRLTFSPLRDATGLIQNYLAMGEDISQWKEDQERKRRLESQLFQAQKLESLGTLAGGIAHDFNNILTGILGFCELADSNQREGLPLGDELAEIRKAGIRAKDLVSRMLAFSRHGESKLVILDLSKAVEEALGLVRASTPASLELRRELAPGLVRADPTQVHQIVLNLCTNAMHAIGEKPGVVTVSIQPVVVGRDEADEIPGLAPGSYFRLSVADTGHGMDEATLGRIFDPFFTTKKPGEGTGLGLAVVRGIVTNHRGALSVRSTPGAGTVFDIYLPSAEGQGMPATEAAVAPALAGAGEEILVVDDELQVANFIAASLRRANFRVLPMTDARDALDLVRREPQRFAAMVTDLTMPHMNGLELISQLRQSRPELPAVIVTGYSRDLSRQEAGAMRHTVSLGKPFTGPELVQALSSLLRGSGAGP